MSRVHTKDSRVFVNTAHLSGSITGWRFEHRRLLSDVTCLGHAGDRFLPGQLGGGLGLRGVFDSAAGDITETLDAAAAAQGGLLATIAPEGLTVGKLAFIAGGNVSARSVDAAVKDAVRMSIDGTPDDGVDWGVLLHPHTQVSADGNGTAVDNAASSPNGGVASLHVTQYTGLDDAVIVVEDSPDNSAWSTLLTFTTVDDLTHERATVAGTVDRYLRVTRDVTGTGSLTFAVAFARR